MVLAWLLLGQVPAVLQLVGGVLIVGGAALVRLDELRVLSTPPVEAERLSAQEVAHS